MTIKLDFIDLEVKTVSFSGCDTYEKIFGKFSWSFSLENYRNFGTNFAKYYFKLTLFKNNYISDSKDDNFQFSFST